MARRKFFKDEENPYDYATDGQVVPSNSTTEYRDEVKGQSEVLNVQPTDTIIRNIDEASRRIDTAGTGTLKVGSEENTAGLNRADTPTDVAIWAGATQEDRATAPFRVLADGTFTAGSVTNFLEWDGVNLLLDGARITKRTETITTSENPTINTDDVDTFLITAQNSDIDSMTTNLTGTPNNGDRLSIRIAHKKTTSSQSITFRAAATYESAASSSALVNKPAGTIDGDIMFAVVESSVAYSNSLPSGWTQVASNNPAAAEFYDLYYKIASSEGADYTFGFAANNKVKVTIVSYGVVLLNETDPLDAISNTSYRTSNTTNRAAQLATKEKNIPLIFFGCVSRTVACTGTPPPVPAAFTEDYDSGSTNPDFWLEVSHLLWTAGGGTGNMDSTLSVASTTTKHAFAVSIKSAIDITWGASFSDNGDGNLFTRVFPGQTKEVEFEWNSVRSLWVTTGNIDESRGYLETTIISPEAATTKWYTTGLTVTESGNYSSMAYNSGDLARYTLINGYYKAKFYYKTTLATVSVTVGLEYAKLVYTVATGLWTFVSGANSSAVAAFDYTDWNLIEVRNLPGTSYLYINDMLMSSVATADSSGLFELRQQNSGTGYLSDIKLSKLL